MSYTVAPTLTKREERLLLAYLGMKKSVELLTVCMEGFAPEHALTNMRNHNDACHLAILSAFTNEELATILEIQRELDT